MTRLIEAADYADLSRKACDFVVTALRKNPASVCIFPTGETPLGLFRELVAARKDGAFDASAMRAVTLDEYAAIARDDRRRLFLWLRRELLDPLGIPDRRIDAFEPSASDPQAEAARMERRVAELGGIDLAVLGLGANGHLGFNEPGSAFDSRTRPVTLAADSIRSNAAYWGSEADVPRQALTLGIGNLLEAREILVLASGAHKSAILTQALGGPVTTDLPATALRSHPAATFIADRAALSLRA
ncbi:MAG: glucosamine-6-phosphate deaminase [Bauldia sp.]